MKKLIIMIGLVFSGNTLADTIARMPMKDYVKTEFDYMFEVKTDKYEKVILDCQGFIMGMSFYYNGSLERKVYMDEDVCGEVNQFLSESKANSEPVCMELNVETNALVFSRKTTDCR